MDNLVTAIEAANHRIKALDGGVRETPLDESPALSTTGGARLLLKGEHLQRTGSFKFRGAVNKLLQLPVADRERGVLTASSGNHGMATALASTLIGIKTRIFLPEAVSPMKKQAIERFGAEITMVPGDSGAAEVAARKTADASGMTYISPYADLDIIAGQGTIGLELNQQCADLAAVCIAVGGGGLISGIGSYLKAKQPGADIIACWPEGAASMYHCLADGHIHEVEESETLSDGTAGGVEAGSVTFPLCQQVIDRTVLVSEAEIAAAMRRLAESERWMVEGAAGVALASAFRVAADYPGRAVAVVLCGRNIKLETFLKVIA